LFFNGSDREELEKIRILEDRLLSKNDLEQFLELILATLCDRLQINGALLVENREGKSALNVHVGGSNLIEIEEKNNIINFFNSQSEPEEIKIYKGKIIIPIIDNWSSADGNLLGFIATEIFEINLLDDEKKDALKKLTDRAATALLDRTYQDSLFNSLEILTPQVTAIQSILASSRFNRKKIINGVNLSDTREFEKWVKDALTHFFGGPRLSQNPLLQLSSVQNRIHEKGEPSITALREVLREAINRLRPMGDRQYTNDWIMFNILDLKFIEGWKVKDLARRLSLSEADFYRKQRIAISSVSEQIILLEMNNNVMN
ncbi:MAG: hypothetical protein MUP85_02910, partial [Candidatus Lokiarchaeota archaeon]|nr:hypothetical protein [Candidatus Lokiarchaeota archaeon]